MEHENDNMVNEYATVWNITGLEIYNGKVDITNILTELTEPVLDQMVIKNKTLTKWLIKGKGRYMITTTGFVSIIIFWFVILYFIGCIMFVMQCNKKIQGQEDEDEEEEINN